MKTKSDNFLYFNHKSSKSEYIKMPIEHLNYSIPCINCDNLIPAADVDLHTEQCQTVQAESISISKQSTATQETNFKITKLRQSIVNQQKLENQLNQKKYLIRADELCSQIIQIQEYSHSECRKLDDICQEIKMLTESFKGTLLVQLFLERLHSLSLVKLSDIKRSIKELNYKQQQSQPNTISTKTTQNTIHKLNLPSSRFNCYNPEAGELQQQSFSESQRQYNQLQNRRTIITKFSGQTQQDQKSEILTKMSSSRCEDEIYKQPEINNKDYENYQQRVFYSKCLHQKAQLPNSHPAQRVQLCSLFKEAMSKRIPVGQWNQFIESALQQPASSQTKQYSRVNSSNIINQKIQDMRPITPFTNFQYRHHHPNY